MANVTVTKAADLESINESVFVKRSIKIGYQDIVNGGTYADNDTATFTIPVLAGEFIEGVGVKLVTAFDDSGAGDELNVEVGDGADPNGYITSAQIHVDATEISSVANTGALVVGGSGARGKLYTANDTVDILLTPNVSTGTDYNLGELTTGEFIVTVYAKSFN
jgi:hypothetical protein